MITFGSATLDIFLKAKKFVLKPEKDFISQKAVCFPFASKVEVKDFVLATGGGGTNAAASLSLLGLKTAYCGNIGNDLAGREILADLKRFKVADKFVFKTRKTKTNLSVIFSWGRDRTAFVWRGASDLLNLKKSFLKEFSGAKWFYLATLSGEAALFFKSLVDFAYKNNIKVFANPGHSQLGLNKKELKSIFKKIDILLLNQEEASFLTGVSFNQEKRLFKELDKLVPGVVIMTKGKDGAVVSDGRFLWQAASPKIKVMEKTGAGDAFGAGFLAGFMKTQEIEPALQLAVANSLGCIQKRGAKQGLLRKDQGFKKIKIQKSKL